MGCVIRSRVHLMNYARRFVVGYIAGLWLFMWFVSEILGLTGLEFKHKFLLGECRWNQPRPIHTKTQQNCNRRLNILRQNGRHFPGYIFKCIFLEENICISLKTSPKCVPDVLINDIPALVQMLAWRRPGNKPLSEPMMVSLLTHISVTRPQWVNS